MYRDDNRKENEIPIRSKICQEFRIWPQKYRCSLSCVSRYMYDSIELDEMGGSRERGESALTFLMLFLRRHFWLSAKEKH